MKMNICDICFHKENKIVKSIYRAGFTHHERIDLCEEHQNWAKQFKTPMAMAKAMIELY